MGTIDVPVEGKATPASTDARTTGHLRDRVGVRREVGVNRTGDQIVANAAQLSAVGRCGPERFEPVAWVK